MSEADIFATRTAALLREVQEAAKRAPLPLREPLQPPKPKTGRLGLSGLTFQRTPSFTTLFPQLPPKPKKRLAEIPSIPFDRVPKAQRTLPPAVVPPPSRAPSSPVSSDCRTEILSRSNSPPHTSDELFDHDHLRPSPKSPSPLTDCISFLGTPELKGFVEPGGDLVKELEDLSGKSLKDALSEFELTPEAAAVAAAAVHLVVV